LSREKAKALAFSEKKPRAYSPTVSQGNTGDGSQLSDLMQEPVMQHDNKYIWAAIIKNC
jgi:hypothetical protein